MAAGDIKTEYAASAAMTVTLASLATSSTMTVGRETTEVVNSTTKYRDYLLTGKITTGTSPTTAKQIRVYVWGLMEDTPTRPLNVAGSDAALTPTGGAVCINQIFKLAAVFTIDATSDQTYWFGPVSIANLFGGCMPKRWGVWVTHETAVNLNATAGNHAIWYTPVYDTVALS